jgi:hypothetical protein
VEVHTVSYTVGAGGYFPGVKRQGRGGVHSAPSSTEMKDGGVIPPVPYRSSGRDN